MYSDDRVASFIRDNFVPVRVHVRDQADDFKRLGERYGAEWTPTILMLDPEEERHRIEGFLPTDDFLAQLQLGLARIRFSAGEYDDAERRWREVVEKQPDSEAAPEARYWAGVARYKATNDPAVLAETDRALREQYPKSSWAKKASVWRG